MLFIYLFIHLLFYYLFFTVSRGDSLRQVILPFGQLGSGLSIIGGRGNGLYICSERHTERSLKTGDQIIQVRLAHLVKGRSPGKG